MAVTRKSRSIELTAAGDAVTERLHIKEIWWTLSGGTVGQALVLLDEPNGSIVARHAAGAAAESVCVRQNCFGTVGLYVDTFPAGGTGRITVYLE